MRLSDTDTKHLLYAVLYRMLISVCYRIVQTEGSRQVTRDTKHYNLQMIIAVGFKVNSERAVQFRKESMLPVLLFT